MLHSLLYLASVVASVQATFTFAVHWGQKAGVNDQQRLLHYCQSSPSDIILLSYLQSFPATKLDFAGLCTTKSSNGVLHCADIAADIKTCQKMGKKVLLTFGGDIGDYGQWTVDQAKAYAQTYIDMFGSGKNSATPRPFDDAVLDGVNMAPIRGNPVAFTAFVQQLKSLAPNTILAALPHCVYPDAPLGDVMANVPLDHVFVRFYNSWCHLGTRNFNWGDWSDWAKTAPNKNVKVYVGIPGNGDATPTGYVTIAQIKAKLGSFGHDPAFGGFALWDVASAEQNNNFGQQLVDLLKNIPAATPAFRTGGLGGAYLAQVPNLPMVAQYWGQNAANSGQQNLYYYCQNTPSDVILLSYLSSFPQTKLNLGTQCTSTGSDGVLHCPAVATDIKACQRMGKKIMLAMGGDAGSYGFSSALDAKNYAQTLLNMFGPNNSKGLRPFDDAVLDGFHLSVKKGDAALYLALFGQLKSLAPNMKLSAEVTCNFPDNTLGQTVENVALDYLFVQYYNQPCNYAGGKFNWKTWSDYAKNKSKNTKLKVFIWLSGRHATATSGFMPTTDILPKLSQFMSDPSFGGFALWDAAGSMYNNNMARKMVQMMVSYLSSKK